MKVEDARTKTDAELRFALKDLKKELFELRFRSATETTNDPARVRTVRRTVARINTILHERAHGIRGAEARN
ncbi:MAG: 50S ribosomal protein L29 [Planctomycetota bacterium]|jgi:large subunit ribosomal protein L29